MLNMPGRLLPPNMFAACDETSLDCNGGVGGRMRPYHVAVKVGVALCNGCNCCCVDVHGAFASTYLAFAAVENQVLLVTSDMFRRCFPPDVLAVADESASWRNPQRYPEHHAACKFPFACRHLVKRCLVHLFDVVLSATALCAVCTSRHRVLCMIQWPSSIQRPENVISSFHRDELADDKRFHRHRRNHATGEHGTID